MLTLIFGLLFLSTIGLAQDPARFSHDRPQVKPPIYSCPIDNGNYCYSGSLQSSYIIRCNNGIGTLGNCNSRFYGLNNDNKCYQPDPKRYNAACTSRGVVYPEDGRYPFLLPDRPRPTFPAEPTSPSRPTPPVSPQPQPQLPTPPRPTPIIRPQPPPLPPPSPPLPRPSGNGNGNSNNNQNTNVNTNTNNNQNTNANQNSNSNSRPVTPTIIPNPPKDRPADGPGASPGSSPGPDRTPVPKTNNANTNSNVNTNINTNQNTNKNGNTNPWIVSRDVEAEWKVPNVAADVDFDELEMEQEYDSFLQRRGTEDVKKAAGTHVEPRTCGILIAIAMVMALM